MTYAARAGATSSASSRALQVRHDREGNGGGLCGRAASVRETAVSEPASGASTGFSARRMSEPPGQLGPALFLWGVDGPWPWRQAVGGGGLGGGHRNIYIFKKLAGSWWNNRSTGVIEFRVRTRSPRLGAMGSSHSAPREGKRYAHAAPRTYTLALRDPKRRARRGAALARRSPNNAMSSPTLSRAISLQGERRST